MDKIGFKQQSYTHFWTNWLVAAGFVLICAGLFACSPERDSRPTALRTNLEADSYQPVQPETWQLPNGLTILFYKDDELPLVRGSMFFPGGSLWVEQTGLVETMGSQLRQGGAGGLSAEGLDEELERMSARIGSGFGSEYGSVSFSSLSTDFERTFKIFADVVQRPRFEPARLSLYKGQVLEGIKRRADDPETIAAISFQQLLYQGTLAGKVLDEEALKQINETRIKAIYQRFVRPQGAILTLVGKIERYQVEKALEQEFAAWHPVPQNLEPLADFRFNPPRAIYFVPGDFQQATIVLGQLGVKRLTPDYLAIETFNEIFGASGFISRLTRRIRTELGLAYGVYGAIIPGVIPGRNLVQLQTKAESTGQAINEVLKVLEDLQVKPVKQEELDEAKRALSNSFVFRFDSPDDATNRAALLRLLKYPLNYDQVYLPGIRAIREQDLLQVAKRRWDLRHLLVIVVGPERAYTALESMVKEGKIPQLQGYEVKRANFLQKLIIK